MTLEEAVSAVMPTDVEAERACRKILESLAKPINGLGKLEDMLMQIAGIQRTTALSVRKKALIVMCADNGVVAEGVTQTDSSVTAVVTNNFARGKTTACIMAKRAGVTMMPVDIGVCVDTDVYTEKVAYGTKNMRKAPAMTREEAVRAIEVGIRMAGRCKKEGYDILLTGEMGIGNTTTSSAAASVLLREPVEVMTGKGAGLSEEGLCRKRRVIREAVELLKPDPEDAVDVLAKVGGLDIAGLTGVFLGGAVYRIPVVIDGFISAVAALAAMRLNPLAVQYMIPSHMSEEQGMKKVMEALGLSPVIHCNMKLGEGTGAVALMPLLEMAQDVYEQMETFVGIEIEPYEVYGQEHGEEKEC